MIYESLCIHMVSQVIDNQLTVQLLWNAVFTPA